MLKNIRKQMFAFPFLLLLFFSCPDITNAEQFVYSKVNFDFFTVDLHADFTKDTKQEVYKAGEDVQFDVELTNRGYYCLLDGILVYSLVAGPEFSVVPPFGTPKQINVDNVIKEGALSVVICGEESASFPVVVSLPINLKKGDYRVDFYLKSPRVMINGNHESYAPLSRIPFRVDGDGNLPQVKIIRSQTRFAGGAHQSGPIVLPNYKQTSFVTVANQDIKESYTGKLITKVCSFGELSGLGCIDVGTQDIDIPPDTLKSFVTDVMIDFPPDVYSIFYQVVDKNGQVNSNYKNRFIISGHEASLRAMALNELSYSKGDNVDIQAAVGGAYSYGESNSLSKDITLKVKLFDRSGVFEKRIFSEGQYFQTIGADSAVRYHESFIAKSDISGYRLCGTLSNKSKILESRCILAGEDNVIFVWPLFYVLIFIVIVIAVLISWSVLKPVLFIILFLGTVFGFYTNTDRVEAAQYGLAAQFKCTAPGCQTWGDTCKYINFYKPINYGGVMKPLVRSQLYLYRGHDDGRFYIPKGTMAYLFRPIWDDPTLTPTVTTEFTVNPRTYVNINSAIYPPEYLGGPKRTFPEFYPEISIRTDYSTGESYYNGTYDINRVNYVSNLTAYSKIYIYDASDKRTYYQDTADGGGTPYSETGYINGVYFNKKCTIGYCPYGPRHYYDGGTLYSGARNVDDSAYRNYRTYYDELPWYSFFKIFKVTDTKTHVLDISGPMAPCVGPITSQCGNPASVVGYSTYPWYVMDIVELVHPGDTPTFVSTTEYTSSVTARDILEAINANTYSDAGYTISAFISPQLSLGDVPDMSNLPGDMSWLDQFIGLDRRSPLPTPAPPAAQIFYNYKSRYTLADASNGGVLSNVAAVMSLDPYIASVVDVVKLLFGIPIVSAEVTLLAPTNFTVSPGADKNILRWSAPAGTLSGFKIKYWTKNNVSTPAIIDVTPATTLTKEVPGTPGTVYYFQVAAVSSTGVVGPYTAVDGSMPQPAYTIVVDTPTSAAYTHITVNGQDYYVDLDGVRTYLWNKNLITSNTTNIFTFPTGSRVLTPSKGALEYIFGSSGYYYIFLRNGENPGDAGYSDRRVPLF